MEVTAVGESARGSGEAAGRPHPSHCPVQRAGGCRHLQLLGKGLSASLGWVVPVLKDLALADGGTEGEEDARRGCQC